MFAILRYLDGAKRRKKLVIVLSGYVLALATGVVGTVLYDLRFSPTDQQTMGGMIAFGEVMFGAGVFTALSTVPTALALWFARRHRGTWELFTIACLAFAVVGVIAVAALLSGGPAMGRTPWIALFSVFGVAQMLGSPIWVTGFALVAWLAPERDLRQRMIFAVAIEVAIGVCALVHFIPASLI